ncbi:MAG: hypothetical protein CLLPBCKN_006196 [Chroococcidiopsis cubana SAG 39.79]|nr:hypothetical protein [Chroococcidiopsis cubana SAG 39.79]
MYLNNTPYAETKNCLNENVERSPHLNFVLDGVHSNVCFQPRS